MRSPEHRDLFRDLLRPELAAIKAYGPVPTPPDVIRLDANESPHPLPPEARELLGRALAEVPAHRYPDVRATRLRELVAQREGVHPDQILFGCGSDEVIALTLNALARPRAGREKAAVVFPDPTFVMFRLSALALGMEPVGVALDPRWDLDVGAMRDALERARPNVVFLPSPNNPTGNLFSPERLGAIVAHARESLVVLDEAYGPFSRVNYRDVMRANANVGRLQTLSKLGLAAARVGWAILPLELAREVDKVRQPYNLNALSQRAAELCLTSLAPFFEQAVATILTERERLARGLGEVAGVTVSASASNFLWVELPVDAGEVHARLLARGVLVRSFHAAGPRLARRVRITVGTPAENDALLAALSACL
jgi:histidinol-phosphate aminotransferase